MLHKTNPQTRHIALARIQPQRHDRPAHPPALIDHEHHDHPRAHHNQHENPGVVPLKRRAAEVQPQQHHHQDPDHDETAAPVDGFETLEEGGARVMDVEEEEQQQEGEAREGQVDVED